MVFPILSIFSSIGNFLIIRIFPILNFSVKFVCQTFSVCGGLTLSNFPAFVPDPLTWVLGVYSIIWVFHMFGLRFCFWPLGLFIRNLFYSTSVHILLQRTVCLCYGRLRMQASSAAWLDGSGYSCAPIYGCFVGLNIRVFPQTLFRSFVSLCSCCCLLVFLLLACSCFQAAAYMLIASGRSYGRLHAHCIRSVHGFGLIIVRASAILAQGPRNNYFQNPTHPHPCFVKSDIFAKHT